MAAALWTADIHGPTGNALLPMRIACSCVCPSKNILSAQSSSLAKQIGSRRNRAVLGIEPRTSRTQSENHATRPNSQLIKVGNHTCHPAHPSQKTATIENDPGKTRACNLWFRGPTPYPLGHRTAPYTKQRQIDFERPRRVHDASRRESKTKRR